MIGVMNQIYIPLLFLFVKLEQQGDVIILFYFDKGRYYLVWYIENAKWNIVCSQYLNSSSDTDSNYQHGMVWHIYYLIESLILDLCIFLKYLLEEIYLNESHYLGLIVDLLLKNSLIQKNASSLLGDMGINKYL